MIHENDYRFCVSEALKIMKSQREKLCRDCTELNPVIYNGLHSYDKPSIRDIYFQMYFSEWLGMHWEIMNNILEHHREYSKSRKKEMTLFFAEYFSKLSAEIDNKSKVSGVAYPELIKEKNSALKEMLIYSERWEQNCDRLRVQMKKSHEQYIHLLKELEEQENGIS